MKIFIIILHYLLFSSSVVACAGDDDKYTESLNGKTIAPFSAHAGSGLADAASLVKSYCPDREVLTGLSVQGTNSINSEDEVRNSLIHVGVLEESYELGSVEDIHNRSKSAVRYYSL